MPSKSTNCTIHNTNLTDKDIICSFGLVQLNFHHIVCKKKTLVLILVAFEKTNMRLTHLQTNIWTEE